VHQNTPSTLCKSCRWTLDLQSCYLHCSALLKLSRAQQSTAPARHVSTHGASLPSVSGFPASLCLPRSRKSRRARTEASGSSHRGVSCPAPTHAGPCARPGPLFFPSCCKAKSSAYKRCPHLPSRVLAPPLPPGTPPLPLLAELTSPLTPRADRPPRPPP
jgi:hypothetical protein